MSTDETYEEAMGRRRKVHYIEESEMVNSFRFFAEERILEYAKKTHDPEIHLTMKYANSDDEAIYTSWELGGIPTEAYIRSLSDGALWEVVGNMFNHKYR